MLEIFRKNRFVNSLLLLPYVIVLRILSIPGDFPQDLTEQGILSNWLLGDLAQQSAVQLIGGILLVYLQCLLLNRTVIHNRLTTELTLFPGLFYALLISFFPEYNGLSSPLVANTLVLIAIDHLFASHKKTGSAGRIFNAGFWLSMAGLVYFGYSILIILGVVGLSMLRTLKSREWLQYLIGYVTPIAITAMSAFIVSGHAQDLSQHFTQYAGFLDFRMPWGLSLNVQIAFFAALFLLAIANYGRFMLKKTHQPQKKINLLYWMMFLGMAIPALQSGIFYDTWIVLIIPMACFLAMIMLRTKPRSIAEFIHFVLLVIVVGMQVWRLL